jgi:hypothetical protein
MRININIFFTWIVNNRKWLFSGIGVAIIFTTLTIIFQKPNKTTNSNIYNLIINNNFSTNNSINISGNINNVKPAYSDKSVEAISILYKNSEDIEAQFCFGMLNTFTMSFKENGIFEFLTFSFSNEIIKSEGNWKLIDNDKAMELNYNIFPNKIFKLYNIVYANNKFYFEFDYKKKVFYKISISPVPIK